MTFYPSYPIAQLNPAPYNPRHIDDASILRLRSSIRTLGLIKPVIATETGTLLAGHQRTKSMTAEGLTHCPAFVLPNLSIQDEIRFNQLHNASDFEFGEGNFTIPPQEQAGCFVDINPDDIQGPLITRHAAKRNEILRLLTKHGEWGSIVATQSGEVLVSKLYANACRILQIPCKAYIVPDSQKADVLHFFGQTYGVFSYEHLEKTTWGQSLAQMYRLRGQTQGGHSRLYEALIIPRLKKSMRILDFGAGQMDYVKMLKEKGFNIRGVEFYYRNGDKLAVTSANRYIDQLCEDLATNGRYDTVICDSVLNSVDSIQAEKDVLLCLSAFCKPGGMIFFSGRSRYPEEYVEERTKSQLDNQRRVNFIDANGFTAIYSRGVWRYQKFHYADEVRELTSKYFGSHTLYEPSSNLGGASRVVPIGKEMVEGAWQIVVPHKEKELPREALVPSLEREFNLPLPGDRRFGRSQDIVRAFDIALQKEM